MRTQIGWLLVLLFVEVCGLVSCGVVKLPGSSPPAPQPPAVFSATEVYDGHHLYEVRLKDGTHCVLWTSSITCDWNNK
jgi:hypothetical protein